MDAKLNFQQLMQKALHELFGDHPIKVIIAREDQVSVEITDDPVQIWKDPERKESLGKLVKGREYQFAILGWPVLNSFGNVMVPVYWKRGQTGWLNYSFAKEVKRKP